MAEFKLDEEHIQEFYTNLKNIHDSLEEASTVSLTSVFFESKGPMMEGVKDFMEELELMRDAVFVTLKNTQSYLEEVTEVVANEDSSIAQKLDSSAS